MKKIVDSTGLNVDGRKISNHSGRKTLVQILKRRGFSNSECMASTRHKSEQGLARYERPEIEIQHNNAINLVEAFGFNKNSAGNYFILETFDLFMISKLITFSFTRIS